MKQSPIMGIYVEILIKAGMNELWEKTQVPKLHERWDLRFSQIDYLPRNPGEAQKFIYATRIGGGLRIKGAGESTGEYDDANGQRTSALKFWSDDPKSLISIGSGYWKYAPVNDGIRFITWYDYRTRFGAFGRLADKLFFRPLIGWATAWSFDRLRMWIEEGISPETSLEGTLVYGLSRVTVALIWFYEGLVPKLIYRNPDEIEMMRNAGIPGHDLISAVSLLGLAEVCFALTLMICWRSRWPLWVTVFAMLLATLGVAVASPSYLTAAFNPLTLNLALAALAVVGLLTRPRLPTANNCHRKQPESE